MRDSNLLGEVLDDALTAGAVVRFRAEGTSMHPTIRDGDVITVAAISADEVVNGDVLLCRHDNRMLAHRVVGITAHGYGLSFDLRGDAKAACDAPIRADAVVGRVITTSRNGRVFVLCGRAARARHSTRMAASRAKAYAVSAAAIVYRAVSGYHADAQPPETDASFHDGRSTRRREAIVRHPPDRG
jgi:signal peptidase I